MFRRRLFSSLRGDQERRNGNARVTTFLSETCAVFAFFVSRRLLKIACAILRRGRATAIRASRGTLFDCRRMSSVNNATPKSAHPLPTGSGSIIVAARRLRSLTTRRLEARQPFGSAFDQIPLRVFQNQRVKFQRAAGIAFEHMSRMRKLDAVEDDRVGAGRRLVDSFRAQFLKSRLEFRAMLRTDKRVFAAVGGDGRNRVFRGEKRQRRTRVDQFLGLFVGVLHLLCGNRPRPIHRLNQLSNIAGLQGGVPRVDVIVDRGDARRDKHDRNRRRFSTRIRVERLS